MLHQTLSPMSVLGTIKILVQQCRLAISSESIL